MYSEEEAVEFGEEEEGQEEGEDIDVDDQEAMDFLRAAEEGNVLGVKVAADVVRCVRSAVSGTDINGACARWFWRSQTCWTCKTSWGTPRRISQVNCPLYLRNHFSMPGTHIVKLPALAAHLECIRVLVQAEADLVSSAIYRSACCVLRAVLTCGPGRAER